MTIDTSGAGPEAGGTGRIPRIPGSSSIAPTIAQPPRRGRSGGLVVREDDGDHLPPLLPLRQVQAEPAAALLPVVRQDEVGGHAGDPAPLLDPHVLQALGDPAAGGEVALLGREELLETAQLDRPVVLGTGDRQRRMEQALPAL